MRATVVVMVVNACLALAAVPARADRDGIAFNDDCEESDRSRRGSRDGGAPRDDDSDSRNDDDGDDSAADGGRRDGPPRDRAPDCQRETPSPDEPGEIPTPRGYAPRDPQPYLNGVRLFLAQYVAGLGARSLADWVRPLPVIGLASALVAPGAEAAAVVYAGDRLGPFRSALFWPLIVSYGLHTLTTLLATTVAILGAGSIVVASPFLALALQAGVGSALQPVFLGAGVTALGVGGALVALSFVGSVVAEVGVIPAAIIATYHLSRTPKLADDNGTGLPRLLPRGKGLRLPGMGPRRGTGDGDGENDDAPREPAMPVREAP